MQMGGRAGVVSGTRMADGDAASFFVDTLAGLTSGVVQVTVSGGTVTPSTFAATNKRIPFGSGTNGGLTDSANLTFDSGVTGGSFGVGTATSVARAEFVTATDTTDGAPTTYDNRNVTIGPTGGATGGALFFSFRASTNIGYIGSLTPGTAWRELQLRGNPASLVSGPNPTKTFTLLSDGRVFGTSLHNTGTVTGTSQQFIASGTYTPSLTAVTNVAASTARKCQWSRTGNVVNVSGSCDIDPTAAGATDLGVSLPIASNIGIATDLAGTAAADDGIAIEAAAVKGDAANDRAQISYTTVNLANHTVYFTFQYEIL